MVRRFLTILPVLTLSFVSAMAADDPRQQVEQYTADIRLLGRHLQASPASEKSRARLQRLFLDWRQRLNGGSFARLPVDGQVDQLLLRNLVETELLQLEVEAGMSRELAPWLPFRAGIELLTDSRVSGESAEPEVAAEKLSAVADALSKALEAIRAAHKKTAPSPAGDAALGGSGVKPSVGENAGVVLPTAYQAWRVSQAVSGLEESLKRWFENAGEFRPDFSWWVKTPHAAVAKGLSEYAKFLREELAGFPPGAGPAKEGAELPEPVEEPLLGRPVGREMLCRLLAQEFVPYSPEELIGIAEREFGWCEGEFRKAAAEMGLSADWKAALGRVKEAHVRPGEQEAFVRGEALRAAAFVREHQLVSVPAECEEWWGTQMLSVAEQRQMPYAAYSGHDILVAYAGASMRHGDKRMSMRGNNRHFTRNVVPHEFIPGHHLQRYMADRHRSYREVFSTPFFVEGWALYWEMRLLDLGYASTPEDRIGALFWRIHRCARILVTLRFHLGQIEPAEMVDFLMERVGHERFGARSEVRRFISPQTPPLYQCGYMLGGLQILALHRELVVSGRMSEREFHDALLRCGPIPVALARVSLLQTALPAGAYPELPPWRFDSARR
jgi:hypothetical protein